MEVATKDNKARVSFAPGKTDVYIIVQGDHETPYPGEQTAVYDDWEQAQYRCEWLNWSTASKQASKYSHPREEDAARKEEARAQLLAAHRALLEQERYGIAIATQLAALRAEKMREEEDAERWERRANQEGCSAKERKVLGKDVQAARTRAEGLSQKIVALQASPVLPSRLAGAHTREKKEGAD